MILVTGGTGLLGNCIVRRLLENGEQVRVLCRENSPRDSLAGLDVEIFDGDLSDSRSLHAAVQGCVAVIHSAALIHIGWSRLPESRRANVDGSRALAMACLEQDSRLVYVSTVDTLPAATDRMNPIRESGLDASGHRGVDKTACAYVVSKTEAESAVQELIEHQGLKATIVHPGFMLGPYDWKPSSGRMMQQVARSPVVAAPGGGCSVCDARDVAAAIVRCLKLEDTGQHYILAGENLSYVDLWTRMLAAAGRRKKVLPLGPAIRLVAPVADAINWLLPYPEGDVNGASIAMGCLNHYYDSSKAEHDLDYTRRPLDQTLNDAWEWLSQRAGV